MAKHKYSDDISIMEGQIAFLQSMVLPLILFLFSDTYLLGQFIPGIRISLMRALLLLIIIAVFFAVFCRQMKIYRRVWEDYEYLKSNEDSGNLNVLKNKKITITNSQIDTVISSDSIKYKRHKRTLINQNRNGNFYR